MSYAQQNAPLPAELRLFLLAQVTHHLTKEELHERPGALRFVRVLHRDACMRCQRRMERRHGPPKNPPLPPERA